MNIFISYAREDFSEALRLYESLREYPDLKPWLDKRNLVGGTSWEDSIERAISTSDIVILLISNISVSKPTFIRREVELIINYVTGGSRVLLLPARLDDVIPPWPEVARIEMIDLFAGWTDGIHRIMAAIRLRTSEIEDRLNDAFPDLSKENRYRRALMLLKSEEDLDSWVLAYEDLISDLSSAVVFKHLDSIHPIYMDEIMDLVLAMNSVRRRRPEAIPSYIFRIHEIAKKVTKPQEYPEAYGVAISVGRLLEAPIRTMFIRDMFNSFVGVARHSLFGINISWPHEWTLCEIAKHLMIQTDARYETNREIAEAALMNVNNDVPIIDLLVFTGRISDDCRLLISLIGQLSKTIKLQLPPVTNDIWYSAKGEKLSNKELDQFDRLKTAGANLAHKCRLGSLMRIGEYLARNENRLISKFGAEIMGVALAAIDYDDLRVTRDVLTLSDQQRETIFDAFETYRDAPDGLISDVSATRLKSYWTDYFYTYQFEDNKPGWDVAPIRLDTVLPSVKKDRTMDTSEMNTHAMNRLLLNAASSNDLSRAEHILEMGADINCTTEDGWTPLLESVVYSPELARLLLSRGADPNIASVKGYTPLHRAAGKGNVEVVQLLLDEGADRFAEDDACLTPLDMALIEARQETADLLTHNYEDESDGPRSNRVLLDVEFAMVMMFAPDTSSNYHIVDVEFDDGSQLHDAKVYARRLLELPIEYTGKKIEKLSVKSDQP